MGPKDGGSVVGYSQCRLEEEGASGESGDKGKYFIHHEP